MKAKLSGQERWDDYSQRLNRTLFSPWLLQKFVPSGKPEQCLKAIGNDLFGFTPITA